MKKRFTDEQMILILREACLTICSTYCERMARLRRCTAMCFSIPDSCCAQQSAQVFRYASRMRTMRTRANPAAVCD